MDKRTQRSSPMPPSPKRLRLAARRCALMSVRGRMGQLALGLYGGARFRRRRRKTPAYQAQATNTPSGAGRRWLAVRDKGGQRVISPTESDVDRFTTMLLRLRKMA